MAQLTPRFSADRAVRDYTERHYLPAAAAYARRTEEQAAVGRKMVTWRHEVDDYWPTVSFGAVNYEIRGAECEFEVNVYLDQLCPADVSVELYADGISDAPPAREPMQPIAQEAGMEDGYIYRVTVATTRPPTDYTARVLPRFEGVSVPLEDARIVWQH
jgi:starch phosphorylase